MLAAEQVQVKVEHGLAGFRAVTDHDPERVVHAELPRDPADREQQVAEQCLIPGLGVREARNLLLRNDEDMYRRLRMDVVERQA